MEDNTVNLLLWRKDNIFQIQWTRFVEILMISYKWFGWISSISVISLFTQGKQNQSITIWNFCVQSLLRSLLMDILAARQETPFRIELDWSHILLTLCIERLREKKSELHLSTDFFLDFHLQYINLYSKQR